jgi:hypothetical protein
MLCYEGDPAPDLLLIAAGNCASNKTGRLKSGDWLDLAAVLGGLPHTQKITALDDGECLCWPMVEWGADEMFASAARRALVRRLLSVEERAAELEAPIHYANERGDLVPGPFLFDDVTLIFAFCSVDKRAVRDMLPSGARLLHNPIQSHSPLLVALAKFPNAYPESNPDARFGYVETTIFIPVRVRRGLGLYVPYIYPSTWEPVLLGREIYGFPKRLGRTVLGPQNASLSVDGEQHLYLQWGGMEASTEPHLIGALVGWLGFGGPAGEVAGRWAFRAGDLLRAGMRLPPFRRVEVYNHKRILAPNATHHTPAYDQDALTHAIFGILRWYQIAQMRDPILTVSGGPLANAGVTVRAAYRTQLDMRLSAGKTIFTIK